MKFSIGIWLLLLLSDCIYAQTPVSYQVVHIDTATHFNPSRYNPEFFDKDLVIDNDSTFKAAFYWSRFSTGKPRFSETTWLKRTIQRNCMSQLQHQVMLDSIKKTVTWLTTVTSSKHCTTADTRHVVISIPTPPDDYQFKFETVYSKVNLPNRKIQTLDLSSLPFEKQEILDSSSRLKKRVVIDDESLLSDQEKQKLGTDFSKNLILVSSYGGDCNLRLMPHAWHDSITGTLILTVYNIWGGCRAGGRQTLYLEIAKPAGEFDIVLQEIQVESWSEYKEQIGQQSENTER